MSELFKGKYKSITWRLTLTWLSTYFVYYGITLLLPTVIHRMFRQTTTNSSYVYLYMAGLSVL